MIPMMAIQSSKVMIAKKTQCEQPHCQYCSQGFMFNPV